MRASGRLRRGCVVLCTGLLALSARDVRAVGLTAPPLPILRDGREDDELVRSGMLTLQLGERRVLFTRTLDDAHTEPAGAVEIARLGRRTLVLTPHRVGAAELRMRAVGDAWSVPVMVQPRPFSNAREASPAPSASPVPPPGSADALAAEASYAAGARRMRMNAANAHLGETLHTQPLTYPAIPAPSPPPDDPSEAGTPRLSGFLRSVQGPVALLDGHPTAVGERAGSWRVDRIESDRVVLSEGNRWLELGLPGR